MPAIAADGSRVRSANSGLAANGEDLPALVKAALGANAMGEQGLAALLAILQLGELEHAVGGDALAPPAP
jgi:hypothetical protein